MDFLFCPFVLSVFLSICSILELEAAISMVFFSILEFEPLIFHGICNIELFMLHGLFATRIHLGLVRFI